MYKSFQDMPVWKDAMDIAVQIFKLTDELPQKEDFGFTSQIRRSALSISGNIAEAYGRHHSKDKMNFYYFARGSLTETESHLVYGQRIGYIPPDTQNNLQIVLQNINKEINKIIHTLSNSKP